MFKFVKYFAAFAAALAVGEFFSAREPQTKNRTRRLVRFIKYFAVFAGVLAGGGFLAVASGVVPIKASSGHWAITAWFLHFSMRRSVATHTLGRQAPPLDDPALALKGARHYDTGCRPCHGSPALPDPRIPRAMTPHPPYLPQTVPTWTPEELFYIVKYGVKFTGMPAWPALHREDEVWAMVAFLLVLPGLDVQGYRQLAQGAPADTIRTEAPRAVVESCGRCHGADGLGPGRGAFPKLAGQRPAYFSEALRAYARGERHSGMMEPVAAELSPETIRELASYYANREMPSSPPPGPDLAEAVARGRTIAREGIPGQGVPSCVDCHGPGSAPTNPAYPALAGQYADYLVLQLELFKKGNRGGSPYAHLMHKVAPRLTAEQMRDVALYFEFLPSNGRIP